MLECDRIEVIGEAEIVLGFRLAGVGGTAVESLEEARKAWNAAKRAQVALVIFTPEASRLIEKELGAWAESGKLPLVAVLPGLRDPRPGPLELLGLIRAAIGLAV